MTWAHPWLLACLPLCLLGALLQALWRRHILKRQASLGSTQKLLTQTVNRHLTHLRFISSWAAIILVVVALAGPRWGTGNTTRSASGAFIVFALDCSRSMLAEDLYPNRMQQTHFKALDMMKENPEHRIALLPFAQIATLRTPFTGDHFAVAEMITDCTPDLFPAEYGFQGTAIGESVLESCRLLQDHLGSSLAIILFSDGSDPDKESVSKAALAAKEHGIRIYGIFFGDANREVGLMIDGKRQNMIADKSSLDELASATGGISVNATNDGADIAAISNHIRNNVSHEKWEERQQMVGLERYQFFLIPAIFLLGLSLLIPSRKVLRHE